MKSRLMVAALALAVGAAGCSSGSSGAVAPSVGAVPPTVSAAPSPSPTSALPVNASAECSDLAAAWSDYQAMYAAAGPTDYHGRETAALDFAKTVDRYLDVDPHVRQLDSDLGLLGDALLRDQSAYLGLGGLSTASTGPGVASALAAVAKDHQAFASSCVVPSPTASPAPAVSDIPDFDQAGDGGDCSMTYGPDGAGNVVTVITLTEPGTLVTHVDGPGGQHIHTQREPQGTVSFTYNFPLSQASVMGAIFYPDSGDRQDCAIGPAR